MSNQKLSSPLVITWVAVLSLAIFLGAGPARAQSSSANYTFLVASGFLGDAGDSTICPAVVESANGDGYEVSGAGTLMTQSKSAYLSCALWFLWPARPVAAQRAGPWGTDAEIFETYRRSDPITKWPLKKTRHEIPELKGLEPATDQSQLPGIMRRVSANLQKFVVNFVDTTALETIKETRKEPEGARQGLDWGGVWGSSPMPTQKSTVQKLRYLTLARREGKAFTLIEYRTDLQGREEHPQKRTQNFIKTTGFAAVPLFFGPLQQPWSEFRYLGQPTISGCRTEAVAFAEHIEPVGVMGRFNIGEASIPILLQGVAWIRTSDYQILKMRTDLLAPLPPLERVTTLVLYAQNQFQGGPTAFWLPQEVNVTVKLGDYIFANRHRYSDYQLYRVESVIKTDESLK